jgi:hypothetical protein
MTVETGLWWAPSAQVEHLASGRWRVVATSAQAPGAHAILQERVYAPATCKTEHNAICWASHSAAWTRLRLHSQGARLLSRVKKKYQDPAARKELFFNLQRQLNDEFFAGSLYRDQDAQDIVARLVLGEPSSRSIAESFLPIADLLRAEKMARP